MTILVIMMWPVDVIQPLNDDQKGIGDDDYTCHIYFLSYVNDMKILSLKSRQK